MAFATMMMERIVAVIVKAGLDPNGDTNWQSGGIQWAETQATSNEPRKYVQLTTAEVTVGANGRVTVFTWGEPSLSGVV